ncbi:MAG: transcription elongation factor GreB [Gammaproteobacteria bacterium]|nr:transcription elongation factor GreB [Gammaproteobacteria bacterium]
MARWRPPQEKSSAYITAEGQIALQQELNEIWIRRRDVTRHLAAAAAEGDRSENAEYIYRKKELRELDRRIRYLQKRIPELKIVRDLPANRSTVYFGARVTLATEADGEQVHCRIVGYDELNTNNQYISIDSPLAKALLGKSLNDWVQVSTPTGEKTYIIVEIEYRPITEDSKI